MYHICSFQPVGSNQKYNSRVVRHFCHVKCIIPCSFQLVGITQSDHQIVVNYFFLLNVSFPVDTSRLESINTTIKRLLSIFLLSEEAFPVDSIQLESIKMSYVYCICICDIAWKRQLVLDVRFVWICILTLQANMLATLHDFFVSLLCIIPKISAVRSEAFLFWSHLSILCMETKQIDRSQFSTLLASLFFCQTRYWFVHFCAIFLNRFNRIASSCIRVTDVLNMIVDHFYWKYE